VDRDVSELSASLEDRHWWFAARRGIIGSLARELVEGDAVAVEVGCGTGGVLSGLPEGLRRVGVDPSPRAIELGRRLHPGLELRLGLAPDDVMDVLPSAGIVLLCDVLEHIRDDVGTLRRVVACLRPGSIVLITVPAHHALWSPHDERHGHERRYELEELEGLWRPLPLRTLLVSPLNWRLYPLARAVRIINRRRRGTFGPSGTDLVLPTPPINALMTRIFASEGPVLVDALHGRRPPSGRRGVSWLAVLQHTGGDLDEA
jgi:SAM-dependent methyltransferase